MFGMDAVEGLVKAKIVKVEEKIKSIDLNHNGLSDLAEIEKDVVEGFAILKVLEAKVPPDKMAAAIDVLFPGLFTAADITSGEAAIDKVAGALAKLPALAAAVKVAI